MCLRAHIVCVRGRECMKKRQSNEVTVKKRLHALTCTQSTLTNKRASIQPETKCTNIQVYLWNLNNNNNSNNNNNTHTHTYTRTHARTQVAEPLWSDLAKEWNWCARAELHFKKKALAGNDLCNRPLTPSYARKRKVPPTKGRNRSHEFIWSFTLRMCVV